MILDGLLWLAATSAWTWVLWFYGRAEYRHSLTHPCPVISLTSPGLA